MAESQHSSDIERLRRLAAEKCNGTLTPAALGELEALLENSAAARREYLEIVSLHANLDWELTGEAGCTDELLRSVFDDHGWGDKPSRAPARRAAAWGLAIAASLCVGALVSTWALWGADDQQQPLAQRQRVVEPSESPPIMGRLTPLAADGHWSFGRAGDRNPDVVRRGDTIWLDRGAASLHLTSNTVAELESPLILQVVSVDRVRVLDGRIRVDVPKGAEGFTVETASAEVIDLGTAFSVNVDSDNTDVVVFDGVVDVKLPRREDEVNGGSTMRFRQGEAVKVTGDGTLSRIVNVQQPPRRNAGAAAPTQPVIISVADNYVREDLWNFYEVVVGGMREDALAFVDRPRHEWNGLTADGMPSYLVGGDYVRTFNNDKIASTLSMEITIARPATMYLLFDDRLAPPDWLLEDFEDTGDDIGVDEIPYSDTTPPDEWDLHTGVGAGKSIDRTHSIWKRVIRQPGVVTLGANGHIRDEALRPKRTPSSVYDIESNMYGIVAVPIGPEN